MNKKLYFTLCIILIIAVLLIFEMPDKHIPQNQNSSVVLKVAGDNNFPPYEYVDESGNYTGFNVDIIRAVGLVTGTEIQFHPLPWNEACQKLKNGDVDIIEGMKYTKDRDMDYDFSKEYLENSQSIFVLSDNKNINRFQDLSGKKVAVQQGDVAVSNLKTLKNVSIVFVDNQEQAIHELLKGTAQAFIGNTLTGVFFINKIGARDRIKIVGDTLNPTKYSMAVKEGDAKTLELINRGLKEIKKNGTYDKIYRKWFGQPVGISNWYIKRVLMFSGSIILILSIIMYIFYRWNSTLKKEVDKQTVEINTANEILLKRNAAIKQERDFRELVLNNIISGVVTINGEGTITFANSPALNLLSKENNFLIGKHYKDTLIKEFLSKDGLTKGWGKKELLVYDKKMHFNYKVHLLNSTDKNLDEIIVIFTDITEEMLIQESLRTKDKLQSLGNLVSSIAHEIRNPLTSIKTYVELMPRKFDNPRFREMVLKDIPQEIDRLNSLINDLLQYSKPRKPFKERINLYEAIDGAMMLLKSKIQKERIEVENNINKNLYISIDKNHLRQVLINILLNAAESMDKSEKRIVISCKDKNNTVELIISDNGQGIDEKGMGNIFNPFYTTKPEGTGLGLFVSYQLLSENGAHVKVDSIKEKGTAFIIEFVKPEVDMHGDNPDS